MKNFYQKILPTQGVYCLTSISKAGFARNLFAESLDDLFGLIETAKKGDNNVFIALSSFGGHSRKADNAIYARSFFVDLDVGEEKPYQTKDEAIAALQAFIDKAELPPAVRVDSGSGIHAYWAFEEDVPSAQWKAYAEKFKAFCLAEGLHIDPVVTADAARILRCPDTLNYKKEVPAATKLLDEVIHSYAFSSFVEYLGEIDFTPTDIFAGIERGLDADSVAVARKDEDNFEYVFQDIAIKSLSDEGCNQIKHILMNSANLPEPLWYAGLSVAGRCVDKDTAIHDMSRDYKGYSHDETIRKTEQSLREATWAHGCDAFEREHPGGCGGCAYRGKVSSPIRLGRRLKEALRVQEDSEEGANPDAVRQTEASKKPEGLVLPEEIRRFARGVNGGIYFIPPATKDKEGKWHQADPLLVFAHDVYPVKRVVGGPEGDVLTVRSIVPKDPVKEFNLPIRSIYGIEELKKRLPENGVYPQPSSVQHAAQYFFLWAEYLQNIETAEIMRMQMGWTEARDAFVIGTIEILPDGSERPAAASPLIRNISKAVTRNGSFDMWKVSANALNGPGWELPAFALLCGLGSPIMFMTPVPGAAICYMSADSGTGKSGSLYAGLSVFCKPKEISVLEGNATENAYIGRYLGMKNLMFGIDETSNIHAEQLSKLLHRISQGKAKLRMQSSVNAERELEQSASLIAMLTSNKDLYDVLRTYKGSPDGEMARLMQFAIKKPIEMEINSARGREIFEPLHLHHGHAGPEFIKYYFKVGGAYVQAVVNKWIARLDKELSDDSAYRHYVAIMAAAFAAGELANEAGIITYDLERIYHVILMEAVQLKDRTVKLNTTNYEDLIADFINKFHAGFLILNDGRVTSEPRMALVGRIEVHNQMQYISKKEFKIFLAAQQISAREFELAVGRAGILIDAKKQRLSNGWKAGMQTPPIAVYAFKTELTPEMLGIDE